MKDLQDDDGQLKMKKWTYNLNNEMKMDMEYEWMITLKN